MRISRIFKLNNISIYFVIISKFNQSQRLLLSFILIRNEIINLFSIIIKCKSYYVLISRNTISRNYNTTASTIIWNDIFKRTCQTWLQSIYETNNKIITLHCATNSMTTFLRKHYTLSFPVTYLNFPNSRNIKFILRLTFHEFLLPANFSPWILTYMLKYFRSNLNANFLSVVYHYASYLICHTCSNIYPKIKESSGEKPVGEYLKSHLDLVWIRSLIVWPAL